MSESIIKIMTIGLIVAVVFLSAAALTTVWGSSAEDQPSVISAVAPIFPPTAIAANINGSVVIEVKIDVNGKVTATQIIEGHPLLRQVRSFEDTARRWQFRPVAGSEALRTARLTFVFRIMPKETSTDELTPVYAPPYQVEVRHRPFVPVVDSDPPSQVVPTQRQGKKRAK
jgi:TonB family protein